MTTDPSQLLLEHGAGASYRQLGERHEISHEQARQLVRQALDDLVLDVIVKLHQAWREESRGEESKSFPGFVIPNGDLVRRQAALNVFTQVCDALRERGIRFKVETVHVSPGKDTLGGLVHRLELEEEPTSNVQED